MSNRAVGRLWGSHNPAEFNHEFKYDTNQPKEWLEEENYFLRYKSSFFRGAKPGENPYQAGDEIVCTCHLDDGTWEKARFEVAFVDEYRVVVTRLTDWRTGGIIPEMKLSAAHKGRGKWDVTYQNGKPYRRSVTKEEAERLVGHPLGKQAEAAEAAA